METAKTAPSESEVNINAAFREWAQEIEEEEHADWMIQAAPDRISGWTNSAVP
jgi:hypothetical protein